HGLVIYPEVWSVHQPAHGLSHILTPISGAIVGVLNLPGLLPVPAAIPAAPVPLLPAEHRRVDGGALSIPEVANVPLGIAAHDSEHLVGADVRIAAHGLVVHPKIRT